MEQFAGAIRQALERDGSPAVPPPDRAGS
jgi:hypothetical protein